MKRFLKFDTEDAKSGVAPVDKNGVIKPDFGSGSQVQANWNEDDSSSPAFIQNKPTSLGSGITWFSYSSGQSEDFLIKGKEWTASGERASIDEFLNAYENGDVRIKATFIECATAYSGITSVVSVLDKYVMCDRNRIEIVLNNIGNTTFKRIYIGENV